MIELLVVAAIILILSLMALLNLENASDRMRLAKSSDDIRLIEQGLERHKAEYGHYPRKLTDLRDKGYLPANFTFENPWSSRSNHIRYFYAINTKEPGLAQAFALGDPGPNANCPTSDPATLSETGLLPCGKPLSDDYPWFWGTGGNLTIEGQATPKSLRGFRPDLRTE